MKENVSFISAVLGVTRAFICIESVKRERHRKCEKEKRREDFIIGILAKLGVIWMSKHALGSLHS